MQVMDYLRYLCHLGQRSSDLTIPGDPSDDLMLPVSSSRSPLPVQIAQVVSGSLRYCSASGQVYPLVFHVVTAPDAW